MKNAYKVTYLGISTLLLMIAFVSVLAQTDRCDVKTLSGNVELYAGNILGKYYYEDITKENLADAKMAVVAGKRLIDKSSLCIDQYQTCEDKIKTCSDKACKDIQQSCEDIRKKDGSLFNEEYESCIKLAVDCERKNCVVKNPSCRKFWINSEDFEYLSRRVKEIANNVRYFDEKVKNAEIGFIIDRFNKAMRAKNTSDIFKSGADFHKLEPDYLDVTITLALVGLNEVSENKNDTYNNETLKYASKAIEIINSNKKPQYYDAAVYKYGTKDNALGFMNYTIGFISYFRQKNKSKGIEYFYKSIQYASEVKKRGFIYELLAFKYHNNATELNKKIDRLMKENGNKESSESKALSMLANRNIDYALIAFAKDYSYSSGEAKQDAYENMKILYKFRFEDSKKPFTDAELKTRLDAYIELVKDKNLPNPILKI